MKPSNRRQFPLLSLLVLLLLSLPLRPARAQYSTNALGQLDVAGTHYTNAPGSISLAGYPPRSGIAPLLNTNGVVIWPTNFWQANALAGGLLATNILISVQSPTNVVISGLGPSFTTWSSGAAGPVVDLTEANGTYSVRDAYSLSGPNGYGIAIDPTNSLSWITNGSFSDYPSFTAAALLQMSVGTLATLPGPIYDALDGGTEYPGALCAWGLGSGPAFVENGTNTISPTIPLSGHVAADLTGSSNFQYSALSGSPTTYASDAFRFSTPPAPWAVGLSLIPRATTPASNSPPTLFSLGDSMADDYGGFNGSAKNLDTALENHFGNAGRRLAQIDFNYFGTGLTRYRAAMPYCILGHANGLTYGSIIYASDGTNAARGTYWPTGSTNGAASILVDQVGIWACIWTNGGILSVWVTNSADSQRFTFDLHSSSNLLDAVLWHTNVSVLGGSNTAAYFTSVSGSNCVVAWDYVCTNRAGFIQAGWNCGGDAISNVCSGLSSNGIYTLMAGVTPDIVLVQARNNLGESEYGITNDIYTNYLSATAAYPSVKYVFVYEPVALGGSSSMLSMRDLAETWRPPGYTVTGGHGWDVYNSSPPFWAVDLMTPLSQNLLSLGYDPHPNAVGGVVAGNILYHQLGFDLFQ